MPIVCPLHAVRGEPVTGRFSLAAGQKMQQIMLSVPEQLYLVSSSAGYGFVCALADMVTRNKAGKALLSLSDGAAVMAPVKVQPAHTLVLTINNEGRMLIFLWRSCHSCLKAKAIA